MASILAAGLDGIMNKIEPPEVVTTDLYRDISRQTQALPTTLSSSLDALEADPVLLESAGKELTDLFVKLKRKEATEYKKFVTDWEWMTYSYHV
jgi:glutamine synthetase